MVDKTRERERVREYIDFDRLRSEIREKQMSREVMSQAPARESYPPMREQFHEPQPQERPQPVEKPPMEKSEKPASKPERHYTYHYEGKSGTLGVGGRVVFGVIFWILAGVAFYWIYLLWDSSPDPLNEVLTWVLLLGLGGLILLYLGGKTLTTILWGGS